MTRATQRALTKSRQRGTASQVQYRGQWLERRLTRVTRLPPMPRRLTLAELRALTRAVCYGAEL